eukprot:COSAG05_NODE_303_length_11737_cov_116.354270_5_plen_52_part_00
MRAIGRIVSGLMMSSTGTSFSAQNHLLRSSVARTAWASPAAEPSVVSAVLR